MSLNDSVPTADRFLDAIEETRNYAELLKWCLEHLSMLRGDINTSGFDRFVVDAVARTFRRKGFVVTFYSDWETYEDYLHISCRG